MGDDEKTDQKPSAEPASPPEPATQPPSQPVVGPEPVKPAEPAPVELTKVDQSGNYRRIA